MKPYNTEQEKKEQVREMFDNIAPSYDRLNHTLSFQIDKLWRRHVVRIVKRMAPRRILDVATGTGDLALAMARTIPGATCFPHQEKDRRKLKRVRSSFSGENTQRQQSLVVYQRSKAGT